MLQSTITSHLQELLQSYMQSNEEFQELINGSKIDISGLELSADSDKRNVTRLLNKGWLAIEVGEDGIINTIQLRMDIFTMLNSSQYTTRSEMLKKLISLTEIYLIDDIRTGYDDLLPIINEELNYFKCEVVSSFTSSHPFHLEFSENPAKSFMRSFATMDIDTILNIVEVLGGKILLTRGAEDGHVYKIIFRHANQMEQPYYVKALKEKLADKLDSYDEDELEMPGSNANDLIKVQLENRKGKINTNLNNSTESNKDASHKVLNDAVKWRETKARKNREDMIIVVRPS